MIRIWFFAKEKLIFSYSISFHFVVALSLEQRFSSHLSYLVLISRCSGWKSHVPQRHSHICISQSGCHYSHGKFFLTIWYDGNMHIARTQTHTHTETVRIQNNGFNMHMVLCVNNELMPWIRVTTLPTGQKAHFVQLTRHVMMTPNDNSTIK